MKRILIWILFNSLYAWAAWMAVNGHQSAGRVFGFFAWLVCVMTVLTALVDDAKNMARAKGRAVPMWLGVTYDFALMALLAWHGWTTLAVVTFIQCVFEAMAYDTDDKKPAL